MWCHPFSWKVIVPRVLFNLQNNRLYSQDTQILEFSNSWWQNTSESSCSQCSRRQHQEESEKIDTIRTEGNIQQQHQHTMKENKERRYRGSNLHLDNIAITVTNHRIPCARVNLILVPIRKLATSNIQFLFHII